MQAKNVKYNKENAAKSGIFLCYVTSLCYIRAARLRRAQYARRRGRSARMKQT